MTAPDAPSDALAVRTEFNKWAKSQTGYLFSPGAQSSDFYFAIWLAGRDSVRQQEAIGTPSAEDLKRAIELLRWYAGFGPYNTRDEAAIALASRLEAWTVAPETTEGLKRVCPYVDKPCGRPDCETIGCQWNTGRPLPRAIDTARSLAEAIEHVEQENSVCIGAPTEEGDKYAEELRTVIAAARRWQAIGTAPEHAALIARLDKYRNLYVDDDEGVLKVLLDDCRKALQSTPAAPLQQPNKGDTTCGSD